MSVDILTAARAEALFTSDLSVYSRPTPDQVTERIRQAVRAHHGTRGCAAEVAAAYGDHPEVAVIRMRWARRVVAEVYSPTGRRGTRVPQSGQERRYEDARPAG